MNKEVALQMAEYLLKIKAVKLNNKEPFTWASGRKSPIYCDNRVTLSYPEIRTFIRENFVALANEQFSPVDVVAGVATGGIPHGALVAQEMALPMVYVRAEEKKHGMHNRIEGKIEAGQSVLVIEDLISTGKSSLLAVDALREAGCVVKGMLAIFTYELEVAQQKFKASEVPLYTLTTYSALIEKAAEIGYVSPDDLASLAAWRENPEKWSIEHGE